MSLLRQIEVTVANGKMTLADCWEGGITDADVLSVAD